MKNIKSYNNFINESNEGSSEFENIVNKVIGLGPIRDDDEKSFKKYVEDFKTASEEERAKIIKSFSEDLEWAYEDIYDKVSDSLNSL